MQVLHLSADGDDEGVEAALDWVDDNGPYAYNVVNSLAYVDVIPPEPAKDFHQRMPVGQESYYDAEDAEEEGKDADDMDNPANWAASWQGWEAT